MTGSLPTWVRHITARPQELRRLRRSLQSHQAPAPPTLESLNRFKAVWRVSIPNQPARFMSVCSGAINQDSFVVHLDAERFYFAWLNSSPLFLRQRASDCVCRAEMPNDYKFKWAVDGFSHGVHNPVPLAEAGAHINASGRLGLGFTNGVTRTFWLLANHCPAFPVKVYGANDACLLHQIAGLEAGPTSLADLFADT